MREEMHTNNTEHIHKTVRSFYDEGDIEAISEYYRLIREYIKNNLGITRSQLREDVENNKVPGVITSFFAHNSIDSFISIAHMHKGVEKIFSDQECFDAVKEAFIYLCEQEALRAGKQGLSLEEKKKFKFKETAYDALRRDHIFEHMPSSKMLVHRFGPYWDNVLEKSGVINSKDQ
jgi:hypothetical protein